MRRVLGIDPGTAKHGWCLIDVTIRTAPIWIQGGWSEDPCALLDTYEGETDMLIAVEQPRALHNPMANAVVMETAWEGGAIYGYARKLGFDQIKIGPQEWRTALVGKSQRGEHVDRKVENELRRLVREMPPRTSVHARDACGVAIVGARIWLAGRYDNVCAIRGIDRGGRETGRG